MPRLKVNARWWVALAFLSPLVVYVLTFGMTLSKDHARWAEFGSAMAGIYAPIVAVLTLAVLVVQVRLQGQMNQHEFNQAHFAQARADIEFYGTTLVAKLEEFAQPGITYRMVLRRNYHPATARELDSEGLRQLALEIDAIAPELLALWTAVYPILTGLAVSQEATFRMTHGSSVSKLIALLGFETCAALDNCHRARTEGRMSFKYQFSDLANEAGASQTSPAAGG